jgi:heat shock protein HtpX
MTSEKGEGETPISPEHGPAVNRTGLDPDPIRKRTDQLRWSTAVVLSGLLLNAGIIVLLVALISDSIVVSLVAVGLMAAIIGASALYHDVMTLRFTGARPLISNEYPWVQPMVGELAIKVGIPEPAVYIADQEGMNAWTTGLGSKVKIAFTTGLISNLTPDEVRAVAAHEVGHAKNRDIALGVWTAAVSAWVGFVSWAVGIVLVMAVEFFKQLPRVMGEGSSIGALLGIVIAAMGFAFAGFLWMTTSVWVFISRLVEMTISRGREFLADTTAVAITGESEALQRALAKISGHAQLNRGANAVRAMCIASPFAAPGFWDRLLATHPEPEHRIEELKKLGSKIDPPDKDWEGVGPVGVVLPLGSLAVLALLAILIPLIVTSGGGGSASAGEGSVHDRTPSSTGLTGGSDGGGSGGAPSKSPTIGSSPSTSPSPSPSPTPAVTLPTTGELRVEMRYADGTPVLDSLVALYKQEVDINGNPIRGDRLDERSTENSGAATFEQPPGPFIVILNGVPGPRFDHDEWSPGIANVSIQVGQRTTVSVNLARIVVGLTDEEDLGYIGRACLRIRGPDESLYEVACAETNDLDRARLDVYPAEYILEYNWASWKAEIGTISAAESNTNEFQCLMYTPAEPGQSEQAPRC